MPEGFGGMNLLIMLAIMLAVMMFVSSRARKKQEANMKAMMESLTPGTWVRTGSGFYGIVSDIDGDVVVLESPSGAESYWDKRAIVMVTQPPFAATDDEDDDVEGADVVDGGMVDDATDAAELSEEQTPTSDETATEGTAVDGTDESTPR